MKPNVFITVRERGKLVRRFSDHNVWTDYGRETLRSNISFSTLDPDTGPPVFAPKHIAFGIGGNRSEAPSPAVAAAYPAGFDMYGTDGRQYEHRFPFHPAPIATLERPVRLSGGTNPYGTAPPTDVWLTDVADPNFFISAEQYGVTLNYSWNGATILTYGAFSPLPWSEIGLCASGSSSLSNPFNYVVAYLNFDTLALTSGMDVEIAWKVGF
jgi:hypothetical protein